MMFNLRLQTWLTLAVLGVGALVTAVAGLIVFTMATAPILHPDPHAAPSVSAADPPAEWREAVEVGRRIVRSGLSEQNLPGLSVAVGVGGEVVWSEGFGWADLTYRTPVTPDTQFRIGTASIVLTSVGAGLLLERNRLKLDDDIRTYVPGFPEKPWPVTVRHLMAHVSGVRNDYGDEGPFGEHCEQTVDGLKLFADEPLLFEPGTRFRFSSFGWILVSAAMEAAANDRFLTFMREQVFEPLGMSATVPDSPSERSANRPMYYFPRMAADPRYGLHPTRPLDFSCYAGAYAFLSTPSDFVRFGLAVNRGEVLRPDTIQLLQTPQRLVSGEETGYGLGWDLETVTLSGSPARSSGHDGTTMGGMVVSLVTFPERGMAVSVMSNIAYADTAALAVSVASAFAR